MFCAPSSEKDATYRRIVSNNLWEIASFLIRELFILFSLVISNGYILIFKAVYVKRSQKTTFWEVMFIRSLGIIKYTL